MNRHDIVTAPAKILRLKSAAIEAIGPDVKNLVENMESATLDWEDHRQHEIGVALAAVQIGTAKKAIIIREDFQDRENRNFQVYLNPKITNRAGPMQPEPEGCLSVPDIYGLVPRHQRVRITAQHLDGESAEIEAEGFLARIFQHEIDHTHGKLFIDYVKNQQFYQLNEDGEFEPLPEEEIADFNTNQT